MFTNNFESNGCRFIRFRFFSFLRQRFFRIYRVIRRIFCRRFNLGIPSGESIGILIVRFLGRSSTRISRSHAFPDFCLRQFSSVFVFPGNRIVCYVTIAIRFQSVVQADLALTGPGKRFRVDIVNIDFSFKAFAVIMTHIGNLEVPSRTAIRESGSNNEIIDTRRILAREIKRKNLLYTYSVDFRQRDEVATFNAIYSL